MAWRTDTSISAERGRAQTEDDSQVKIVTKHADEMLGCPPAVLEVDFALSLEPFKHDGQARGGSPRAALEERLGQRGKPCALRNDGPVERQGHRGHNHIENASPQTPGGCPPGLARLVRLARGRPAPGSTPRRRVPRTAPSSAEVAIDGPLGPTNPFDHRLDARALIAGFEEHIAGSLQYLGAEARFRPAWRV